MTIIADNAAEDAEITEVVDAEIIAILTTATTIKTEDPDVARDNVTQITVEGVVMIIHIEDEEDNGMEMTLITVTEIVGIEIMIARVILTEVDDGITIVEVKVTVIVEEVDDGTPISSIMIQGTSKSLNFKTQITIDRPQWDINIDIQFHTVNTHTSPSSHNTRHKCQPPLNKPLTFVNCATSQGHYDYQCQFAGDFMARTQKAFNQGRSYSHQDPNNGEWSQGDGDNNDPNGQPFQ